MRRINEIIVHCSATAEGKAFTTADIRRWHMSPPNNWRDIGYHYVIELDGSIHKGRPIEQIGAHAKGHNRYSIGICYVGGCAKDGKTPKDTRTPEQKQALTQLLTELHRQFPKATLHAHREFANKACPSFDCHADYDYIFNDCSV